ncbi:MAG: type IV secretory system conjugative DNA transfer family protein [Tenericutes bacterium]|nr:type IV secretory system conjugative DNA transfer family protein [Mycoplasmatota bacterium]
MKLKFRADPHDLLIFGIFAVFLLYVVAIVIVNLATFAAEGTLSGFNPLPAFGPKYILTTIVFFILALAALFISVSSYFFEREKGLGITTEKKDKGYSRWAKDKEIKEELECVPVQAKRAKAAGIPLIVTKEELWVDNGEYHSLIIGATGSGKTQGVVFPQVHSLAKARESMIITDPKGEIYEKSSVMLREMGYQILLLNFRDPQNGSAWNPMTLPYKLYKSGNHDKAIELLDDLALNILYDDSNKNADPFWEKTSADYFSGIALGLFEDAKEDEININSISLATTVGEEKFGGSTYIKEYFNAKDPASAAAINASSTIMAPTETKGSILSVFKQKVKLFASRDNLSEMLSYSSVDLESIGERPTAVFIVIQDEKKTYHSLVTILLKQIYETLISTAQKHGGKLPVRTNFILDEFANMPPLKDVTTMITAARSRRIRFTMIIQNFAQLDAVYGKDDAETIRGNCGNIIYLITTELKALEEISKMCGEVKSKKDEKTASTPLVTVSDLQRMKQYETVILRMRKQPFKTKLTPDWQIDWGRKYPLAKYPNRPKREVHTFDIKEFVKNQKKKKLLEMMNAAESEANGTLPEQKEKTDQFDYSEKKTYQGRSFGSSSTSNPMIDFSSPFLEREKEPAKRPYEPVFVPSESKPSPVAEFTQTPSVKPLEKESSSKDDGFNFDVDELVKKIDAKIAELEEEEKRNKAQEVSHQEIKPTPPIDNVKPLETTPVVENKTNVNNLELSDDESDDDFFDDFFDN